MPHNQPTPGAADLPPLFEGPLGDLTDAWHELASETSDTAQEALAALDGLDTLSDRATAALRLVWPKLRPLQAAIAEDYGPVEGLDTFAEIERAWATYRALAVEVERRTSIIGEVLAEMRPALVALATGERPSPPAVPVPVLAPNAPPAVAPVPPESDAHEGKRYAVRAYGRWAPGCFEAYGTNYEHAEVLARASLWRHAHDAARETGVTPYEYVEQALRERVEFEVEIRTSVPLPPALVQDLLEWEGAADLAEQVGIILDAAEVA